VSASTSLAASPARGPAGTSGRLRLGRPAVRTFANTPRPAPTAYELRLVTDFLDGFGVPLDLDLYARGGGNSFAHMGKELLDGLEHPLAPLDHAVLAYHLPDPELAEVAGCRLAELCPGDPDAFSVSEQGPGATFTALRILDCMCLAGEPAAAAVFVFDHATVFYRDPETHDGSVGDCAVLLRTEPADTHDGADGATVDLLDESTTADPNDALEALALRAPGTAIVAGRALADRLRPDVRERLGVVEGPAHRFCTSAWSALADRWPLDRYTVVADYDPPTGRLFQAGLRPGGQG
jgi:hypothetical protein